MGTIPDRQYGGARLQDGPQPMADGQVDALCEALVLGHNGHAGAYARRPIRGPKTLSTKTIIRSCL